MDARLALVDGDAAASPSAHTAPPPATLEPWSPAELRSLVLAGENESDACERILAQVARMQAALDLAIAEGLLALGVGDRLVALGFSSLRDYAREYSPRTRAFGRESERLSLLHAGAPDSTIPRGRSLRAAAAAATGSRLEPALSIS